MNRVRIENGVIIYYGNAAGYVSGEKAVIDSMFQSKELDDFITSQKSIKEMQRKAGVFERLAAGKKEQMEANVLKNCRVWQLKPETDIMKRFIGYEELKLRFGEPSGKDYQVVYDGEVESNDLETLYVKFNIDRPLSYSGHSLSISDVLELYDDSGSEFYYCDRFGFQTVTFEEFGQDLQMKY